MCISSFFLGEEREKKRVGEERLLADRAHVVEEKGGGNLKVLYWPEGEGKGGKRKKKV